MPRNPLSISIPKSQKIGYLGKKSSRKPFKISTKKRVWMKAAGKNPDDWNTSKFSKTSKCMNPKCNTGISKGKRLLHWGDRSYEFDHKNNNNADNSEKNCFLVCKICHGIHTKHKTTTRRDSFTGFKNGVKKTGVKIGYKKEKKKTTKKAKPKKKKARAKRDPFGLF